MGISVYTEPQVYRPQLKKFSVEFPRSMDPGNTAQGNAPDATTTTSSININETNVTAMTFTFSFTDNYRLSSVSPASATFTVISPDGDKKSAQPTGYGSSSAIAYFKPLCPVPENITLLAKDQDEAHKMIKNKYPGGENGTGDWAVEITVSRDYASPLHPILSSISWSVTTKVETYHIEINEYIR